MLYSLGYDVWMINIRGNQYSKNHTRLESCTGCSEYWDFTHHDSAIEDYPVTIDYILETTGFENLFFVGYSMGTTQYLILLSERPEYNEKIKAGILLGPTAFGGHATNPMIVASPYAELIGTFITKLGFEEFMPNFLEIKTWLAHSVCKASQLQLKMCRDFFALSIGMEPKSMNASMAPLYMSHMPAGTNIKTMVQMGQIFRNGDHFYKYDHGLIGNMRRYGSYQPDEYDIRKVSAPTALIGGPADGFSDPKDNEILAKKLPNVLYNKQVKLDSFGHLDFILGVEAKSLVYDYVLYTFNQLR